MKAYNLITVGKTIFLGKPCVFCSKQKFWGANPNHIKYKNVTYQVKTCLYVSNLILVMTTIHCEGQGHNCVLPCEVMITLAFGVKNKNTSYLQQH